jgi:hypothetical protein
MPGGVFRDGKKSAPTQGFCLDKILLKLILDFGIRENKKDETEVSSFDYFYVYALAIAVLLRATAAVICSIASCKASSVTVAFVQAPLSVSPEIAESASPQIVGVVSQ